MREREREEQRERERRKERQDLAERERRHQSTSDKLCELELLRQQDHQRMRELQQTLAELEREEREMVSQRLSGSAHTAAQPPTPPLNQQLLKENSVLSARVAQLSEEQAALRHALASLEHQRRRSEDQLARGAADAENRPAIAADLYSGKVQRLYERYLRAESFRKSLVYQKRYLLLLLGGFQDCEQATLCLVARMGAHPSPPRTGPRGALTRFRAAVRAVIAISRLKFLTRKWQRATRRGAPTSSTVNGHAAVSRTEVLRQQHPGANHISSPPTRDSSPILIPPMKSPFRLQHRVYSSPTLAAERTGEASQEAERSLTEYIHHLEKVQQRLGGGHSGSATVLSYPKKSDF